MLLFYTSTLSPRIKYISRLIFQDLLGLSIRYTQDKEEYLQSTLPKINYSRDPLQSGIFLQSVNLLFESDISEQDVKSGTYKGVVTMFSTGRQSLLPFDPLAASFFIVSRYEEYMPFIADAHGRFPAKESVMYRLGTLNKPLVNAYAEILATLLEEHNPNIVFSRPSYRFYNSVDIDNAAAFLGKGIFRIIGGYMQDILSLNFKQIGERSRSLVFEMGIHPSYRSNENFEWLEEEITSLQRVLKKDIKKSRQHFLKIHFPSTFRNLLQLEISDDYSIGYASEHGFRAGICTPFRFYDIEQEVETPLIMHPFPFMDGTFIYYLKLSPDEALKHILEYIEIYRHYGGEFIPIWHNRIYSEKEEEWKGWNKVFEEMVKAAV